MAKFNEARELSGNRLTVVGGTPNRLKKMTGTRFSKILGCNRWSTPFQAWCEIMKVAEPPFEGNKYTEAGQAIEPKLIEWCRTSVSPYIVAPKDYYDDCRNKYDYFDDDIYGGMWDALAFNRPLVTEHDIETPIAVIECKTTSRPQDWEDGVPEHYKAQGLLYAALLGVRDVYFPVAFLSPDDYDYPEGFVCNDNNTRVYHVTTDERVGEFENIFAAMEYANTWYTECVDGNISPVFDDKKDKDYLVLVTRRTMDELGADASLAELCRKLGEIDDKIAELESDCGIDYLKNLRKNVNKEIQTQVKQLILTTDGVESIESEGYVFTIGVVRKVDYDRLAELGVYDEVVTETTSIRTKRG